MAGVDIEKIKLEHIPEGIWRTIAEEIGIGNLLSVVRLLGGEHVYVVKEEALTRNIRNQLILEEFNGVNYRELAKKYGVTPQWIRVIVRESRGGG